MSKKAICPTSLIASTLNTYNNDCVFRQELKVVTVSPVFKSKESYLKSSYRPISVLPSVSKIFERTVCGEMQSYFSNLLSNLDRVSEKAIVHKTPYFGLLKPGRSA